MPHKSSDQTEASLVIALKILGFIASDSARLQTFLEVTGTAPAAIPAAAQEPQFLAGVFDYLLGNQTLLLLFTEMEELDPDSLMRARQMLPGGFNDI